MTGRADYFAKGSYNVLCDECSWKYKAWQLKKRWDGLMVCPPCFEKRNPQDFVRGVKDAHQLPFTRPEPPDLFVDMTNPIRASNLANPPLTPIDQNVPVPIQNIPGPV